MSQDYEADDYAASLVEKFQGPDLQTYVLTKDHDYFQLVSEYTACGVLLRRISWRT